jgi:hypothetical protein
MIRLRKAVLRSCLLKEIVHYIAIVLAAGILAACGGKSFNSAEALKEYLDKQPANSPDKPIKVSMNANTRRLKNTAKVIKDAGKYVSLDLSGSSLTTIPEAVFDKCTMLAGITMPNSVTNITLFAFEDCTSLTSVTIPKSVAHIGRYAFEGCASLTSVTFQGTVTSDWFTSDAFYGLGDLRYKFYATDKTYGTPGTYTRPDGETNTWTKQ